MPNGMRMMPGGDFESAFNGLKDDETALASSDLLAIRDVLPSGYGLTPDNMGAFAWEMDDDEAAAFAYRVADRIAELRLAL